MTDRLKPCDIPQYAKIVSDEELEAAFLGTDFGKLPTNREILADTTLQICGGYHCGYTAVSIAQELRLIGKNKRNPVLTKKGREYMFWSNYRNRHTDHIVAFNNMVPQHHILALEAIKPYLDVDCPEMPAADSIGWQNDQEMPITFGQVRAALAAIDFLVAKSGRKAVE